MSSRMTEYNNVNNETSFIYVISSNCHQKCDSVYLGDLMDNEIIKTRRF